MSAVCKFKILSFQAKRIDGYGNYSVGIAQGEKLSRVFYMMDSNGCNGASEESMANGHTVKSIGFKRDQIDWYTTNIGILKEFSSTTKISFAYHIQMGKFKEVCESYGFKGEEGTTINIDRLETQKSGDYGLIGERIRVDWDQTNSVYDGLKELGVDSMFVGHEHCNSFSIVYEGIRFQFGQKSSQYDAYNVLSLNGNVSRVFGRPTAGTTSLIGGSVIVLSQEDGNIENSYIYYCGQPNGQIDWKKYD